MSVEVWSEISYYGFLININMQLIIKIIFK